MVRQIFLRLFAKEIGGQILHLIHQWQFIGMALLILAQFLDGVAINTFGIDGKTSILIYHSFLQMVLLLQSKVFRDYLEIAISLLLWQVLLNIHF